MTSYNTDAARWRALTVRDPLANGHFVYAVKSTNVFCRPTCPARLARRANIGFFKTAKEASTAGFRACKRCKPDEEVFEDTQGQAVNKACTLIDDAIRADDSKALRLHDLAKNVGFTPRYFHKVFKDRMAMTPKEYVKHKTGQLKNDDITPPGLEDPGASSTSFDVDDFNFNDLMNFDFDPNLPLDEPVLSMTQSLESSMPALSTFGQEVDVNTQPDLWFGVFNPNTTYPDFDATTKLGIRGRVASIDDSLASVRGNPLAVSTFEMDAALLLSGDVFLPGVISTSFSDEQNIFV